jgi:hypothetical protein
MFFLGIILLNENLLSMIIYVGTLISPRYGVYAALLMKAEMNTGLSLLIYALPSILVLVNSKTIIRQDNGNFILNLNACFVLVMILVYRIAAFGRVHMALMFIPVFSLQILYDSNKRFKTLYHYFFIVVFFALYYRYIGHNTGPGTMGIFPYNSIINGY